MVNQATMGMIYAGGLIGSQSAGAVVKDSTHKGNVTVTAPKNPTAGGIAAAVCFAVVMALLFRPGDKR